MEDRPIHPDFLFHLELKEMELVKLFADLRDYIFEVAPTCNEILYHTHALTSVFSLSDKLSDAFCMIPIYTSHLNLGFNQGTCLPDPKNLLQGTGKLIRHIPVRGPDDYRKPEIESLILSAINHSQDGMKKDPSVVGATISKIK
ncbi:MAG: DUF1801 domain-containing protein [Ekhidna sp.]|uniref:DUF1801 domain-containing protein n=1 Tax=Ekhidna sp. TaxID=2608089 RepID=UPI0032EF6C6C